jgi:hypothetical protein
MPPGDELIVNISSWRLKPESLLSVLDLGADVTP